MVRASMARFFNHIVQADCFVLLGVHYCLVIDELFRYKQACSIKDHSADTFKDFFLANWVRFFGPMMYLVVDQEGALAGIEMAAPVSYTHLRAHETSLHLVCRLLLEKKKPK